MTEELERLRDAWQQGRVLQRERGKMFRDLATRARNVTVRLGVDSPDNPSGDDAAAYLKFFAVLVERLEESAADVDTVIDEECRELLGIAATCVFSNLHLANPNFDFSSVLRPVETKYPAALEKEVRKHVDALVELYVRVDGDGEEDQDDEELQDDEENPDGSASSA